MTLDPDIALTGVDPTTDSAAGTAAPTYTRAAGARVLPLDPGATVEVTLASGGVRVRGTDEACLVIRTRDGRSLDDAVQIDAAPGRVRIRDAAGELRLGPIRFSSRRSRTWTWRSPGGRCSRSGP